MAFLDIMVGVIFSPFGAVLMVIGFFLYPYKKECSACKGKGRLNRYHGMRPEGTCPAPVDCFKCDGKGFVKR